MEGNPNTTYLVLRGNHDMSRDLERKGAFDLFELITVGLPNVRVVKEPFVNTYGMGFFPWHPTKSAADLIQPCEVAFGHWDTIFGEENMIPTEALAAAGCKLAYTGHVHKPDRFERDGVEVVVVGSLQPYAHGEGDLYVTLTLAQLQTTNQDLRNKCVRVVLGPGETFDQELDCLQLTIQRIGGDADEWEEVTMGDFDMEKLFAQAFEQEGVHQNIRELVLERYHEARG
jgi:DNA repair exonuclease SbcCD nuclease subunit